MSYNKEHYKLYTNLSLATTKKFLSFSDMHYSVLQHLLYRNTMKNFFSNLVTKYKNKVDAVLIPGDLLLYFQNFTDSVYFKKLVSDLSYLSYNLQVPIFISYGNHDLPFDKNKLNQKSDLFDNLDDRKNGIYVLDNEQVSFDNVTITGFSPCREAYGTERLSVKKALQMAKEDYSKCNFKFEKGKVNVFMSHETRFFCHNSITSSYGKLYEDITFFVGGHFHDGYLPLWLQRIFKDKIQDKGFFETVPPIIDMCRGLVIVSKDYISKAIISNHNIPKKIKLANKECASIVNRGIAKYTWFIPSRLSYTEIEVFGKSKAKILKNGIDNK